MSEHVELVLELTPEDRQRIERLAHERGYAQAYLLALVDSDEIDEATESHEDEKEQLLVDFREAWHDAMTGNTRPVSELWDELEKDDE